MDDSLVQQLAAQKIDLIQSDKELIKQVKTLQPGVLSDWIATRYELAKIHIYQYQTPIIIADVDFDRSKNGTPTLALSALVKKRQIVIPYDWYSLKFLDMEAKIGQLIRDHYNSLMDGELEFWGKVKGYQYVHIDGVSRYFDLDGKWINKPKKPKHSEAFNHEFSRMHYALFPEDYDQIYDSNSDAMRRKRGENPMSDTYLKLIEQRHEFLGSLSRNTVEKIALLSVSKQDVEVKAVVESYMDDFFSLL